MFWVNKLKKSYKINKIRRGYRYAAEILLKQNTDGLANLKTMVAIAETFNDFGYFDQGIVDAISDYKYRCTIKVKGEN